MPLNDRLQVYCPNVSGDERKLVATWFGDKITSLTEDNYKDALNLVVAEICILNGLETYDEVTQQAMYIAQMRIIAKFIYEGFSHLTIQELTTAFHYNLHGKLISESNKEIIKQYKNKKINCEFIGQVLTAYCKYKEWYINNTDGMINVVKPPELLEQKIVKDWDEHDENERRIDINRAFTAFLTDPKWNYKLMDYKFYHQLVKDGALNEDIHKRFEKNVRNELLAIKQREKFMPSVVRKGKKGRIIEKHYDNHLAIDSELHKLRNGVDIAVDIQSKQTAVVFYFKELRDDGRRTVYVKEAKENE